MIRLQEAHCLKFGHNCDVAFNVGYAKPLHCNRE